MDYGLEEIIRTGVKNLCIDELCKQVKISKRTFYELFSSKKDFIKRIALRFVENVMEEILKDRKHETALHEMLYISKCIKKFIGQIPVEIVQELVEQYDEVWNILQSTVLTSLLALFRSNLERGKREGFYRKNVAIEEYALLRIVLVEVVHSRLWLNIGVTSMSRVYDLVIDDMYMNSILTEEGRRQWALLRKKSKCS